MIPYIRSVGKDTISCDCDLAILDGNMPILLSLIDYGIKTRKVTADIITNDYNLKLSIEDREDITFKKELSTHCYSESGYNFKSDRQGELTHTIIKNKKINDGYIIDWDNIGIVNAIVNYLRNSHYIPVTHDMVSKIVDKYSSYTDGSYSIIKPLNIYTNNPLFENVKAYSISIYWFKEELANIDDFLRSGTLTPYMARFLEACVQSKLNMIICGGTGSGKTTLLNVLSSFIGDKERIVTIEDAAELRLRQSHVISLETRLVNYEGQGEVTIRDLVINSLRMRPDRIIVGEVRGKEAFDMLQAMNTGHAGSMTTMHANSSTDALNRLETMILMAGMEIPIKALREYIENAIDIVVEVERLSDGRRRVTNISEIVGFKGDTIELKRIFGFTQIGLLDNGEVKGEFILEKYVPKVYDKIKAHGINNLRDIFENR